MSADVQANSESPLRFLDLLPGIGRVLTRLPTRLGALKKMGSFTPEDKNSVGLVLEFNAEKNPESLALLYEEQKYTHRELNEWVNRYANYFSSIGVIKGDVAAVFLDNRPEMVVIIGALAKLGAVASLINPNLREKVLLHCIHMAKSQLFLVGEEMLAPFEAIKPQLQFETDDILCFMPDGSDTPAPDGYLNLADLTKDALTKNPDTTATITLKDPFAYIFTSGTTGMPKASIQTHLRWISAGYLFGQWTVGLTPADIIYIPLPLYHSNGLYASWSAATNAGAAIALRRKFSASSFWADTRKFKATTFGYIGELCRYLMNQPPSAADRKNPIKKVVGNGMRPDIWRAFKKRFGISKVFEFYGSSEGNVIFTNILNIDCCAGLSLSSYAIVKYDIDINEPILDKNGYMQKVERGEIGLLLGEISSGTPFKGYTDKTETNKKIFRNVLEPNDQYFNTGDLVRDIGFRHLQFIDRLGDTFRWKGENVSTTEVETIINQVNGVEGSTVYGVSIPGTDGRAGMATIITVENGSIDHKELAQSLKSALPSYAVPIFIRIKSHFDTTATFKIKKVDLGKEAFDLEKVSDPLYIMLPGESEYQLLTEDIHRQMMENQFRF